eukprot:m.182698 g.182698  ORF g.182698 m.182698 type:complete len:2392 (-) comp14675_c1_seq1:290-7465(-)
MASSPSGDSKRAGRSGSFGSQRISSPPPQSTSSGAGSWLRNLLRSSSHDSEQLHPLTSKRRDELVEQLSIDTLSPVTPATHSVQCTCQHPHNSPLSDGAPCVCVSKQRAALIRKATSELSRCILTADDVQALWFSVRDIATTSCHCTRKIALDFLLGLLKSLHGVPDSLQSHLLQVMSSLTSPDDQPSVIRILEAILAGPITSPHIADAALRQVCTTINTIDHHVAPPPAASMHSSTASRRSSTSSTQSKLGPPEPSALEAAMRLLRHVFAKTSSLLQEQTFQLLVDTMVGVLLARADIAAARSAIHVLTELAEAMLLPTPCIPEILLVLSSAMVTRQLDGDIGRCATQIFCMTDHTPIVCFGAVLSIIETNVNEVVVSGAIAVLKNAAWSDTARFDNVVRPQVALPSIYSTQTKLDSHTVHVAAVRAAHAASKLGLLRSPTAWDYAIRIITAAQKPLEQDPLTFIWIVDLTANFIEMATTSSTFTGTPSVLHTLMRHSQKTADQLTAMAYQAETILPTQNGFRDNVEDFLTRYVVSTNSDDVRCAALDKFAFILERYPHYASDCIDAGLDLILSLFSQQKLSQDAFKALLTCMTCIVQVDKSYLHRILNPLEDIVDATCASRGGKGISASGNSSGSGSGGRDNDGMSLNGVDSTDDASVNTSATSSTIASRASPAPTHDTTPYHHSQQQQQRCAVAEAEFALPLVLTTLGELFLTLLSHPTLPEEPNPALAALKPLVQYAAWVVRTAPAMTRPKSTERKMPTLFSRADSGSDSTLKQRQPTVPETSEDQLRGQVSVFSLLSKVRWDPLYRVYVKDTPSATASFLFLSPKDAMPLNQPLPRDIDDPGVPGDMGDVTLTGPMHNADEDDNDNDIGDVTSDVDVTLTRPPPGNGAKEVESDEGDGLDEAVRVASALQRDRQDATTHIAQILQIFTTGMQKCVPFCVYRLICEGVAGMTTCHAVFQITTLYQMDVANFAESVQRVVTEYTAHGELIFTQTSQAERLLVVERLFYILGTLSAIPESVASDSIVANTVIPCLVSTMSQTTSPAPAFNTLVTFMLHKPDTIRRYMGDILSELHKRVTNPHLQLAVLEFLSTLGRVPLFTRHLANSTKTVLATALTCLETQHRRRTASHLGPQELSPLGRSTTTAKPPTPSSASTSSSAQHSATRSTSGTATANAASRRADSHVELLAKHVITLWFIKTPLDKRIELAEFIRQRLSMLPLTPLCQIILAVVQRYVFTNEVSSLTQPLPAEAEAAFSSTAPLFAWSQGQTIISMRTNSAGWMDVRVRAIAGASAWLVKTSPQALNQDPTVWVDSFTERLASDRGSMYAELLNLIHEAKGVLDLTSSETASLHSMPASSPVPATSASAKQPQPQSRANSVSSLAAESTPIPVPTNNASLQALRYRTQPSFGAESPTRRFTFSARSRSISTSTDTSAAATQTKGLTTESLTQDEWLARVRNSPQLADRLRRMLVSRSRTVSQTMSSNPASFQYLDELATVNVRRPVLTGDSASGRVHATTTSSSSVGGGMSSASPLMPSSPIHALALTDGGERSIAVRRASTILSTLEVPQSETAFPSRSDPVTATLSHLKSESSPPLPVGSPVPYGDSHVPKHTQRVASPLGRSPQLNAEGNLRTHNPNQGFECESDLEAGLTRSLQHPVSVSFADHVDGTDAANDLSDLDLSSEIGSDLDLSMSQDVGDDEDGEDEEKNRVDTDTTPSSALKPPLDRNATPPQLSVQSSSLSSSSHTTEAPHRVEVAPSSSASHDLDVALSEADSLTFRSSDTTPDAFHERSSAMETRTSSLSVPLSSMKGHRLEGGSADSSDGESSDGEWEGTSEGDTSAAGVAGELQRASSPNSVRFRLSTTTAALSVGSDGDDAKAKHDALASVLAQPSAGLDMHSGIVQQPRSPVPFALSERHASLDSSASIRAARARAVRAARNTTASPLNHAPIKRSTAAGSASTPSTSAKGALNFASFSSATGAATDPSGADAPDSSLSPIPALSREEVSFDSSVKLGQPKKGLDQAKKGFRRRRSFTITNPGGSIEARDAYLGGLGLGGTSSTASHSAMSHLLPFAFMSNVNGLVFNPHEPLIPLHHHNQRQPAQSKGKASPAKANSSHLTRALATLDQLPTTETHQIGIVYIAPGQSSSEEFFSNQHGSPRFTLFLMSIGNAVRLKGLGANAYCGGLDDKSDADGKYTIVWEDGLTRIVFHVATLLPNSDHHRIKKRIIENDYVTIVYNDSGATFSRDWFTGQVNYAYVLVEPAGAGAHKVSVRARDSVEMAVSSAEERLVLDTRAHVFARQLALHASIAAHQHRSIPSSWRQRFKEIQLIQSRFEARPTSTSTPIKGSPQLPRKEMRPTTPQHFEQSTGGLDSIRALPLKSMFHTNTDL